MTRYHVTGMNCAACQARVEKAVSKLDGVTNCSVSLLMNSMLVEGSVSPEEVIRAVERAGYGAELQGTGETGNQQENPETLWEAQEEALQDTETPRLKKRLLTSVVFLVILLYVSMGHMLAGFPLPSFLEDSPSLLGLVQFLLAGIVLVINRQFFISGYKSLFSGAPNMDTLIALGSSAAFIYSTVMWVVMICAQVQGDILQANTYLHEFYFESAAMIVTLITVGKMLEAYSKGKTTNALKSLIRTSPKTAAVLREGKEVIIPAMQVQIGDIFVVRPGEMIPTDGIVIEGSSAVNESSLTGESLPVDKTPQSQVFSGTLNQSGFLTCQAERVGADTLLSQMIQLVSDAAATKAPVARLADKISGIFVPVVIGIAVLTIIVWLILGADIGYTLARGISVLVISCPCALGLATPVAIMVGNGVGAKNGILFKHAQALQEAGKVQIVVLDKTGTLTTGTPRVTELLPAQGHTEVELLQLAVSLEQKSEHPLASAILTYGKERQVQGFAITDFQALPGNGLCAGFQEKTLCGGSETFIRSNAMIPEALAARAMQLAEAGKTPLFFTEDHEVIGMIAVADTLKEDSVQAVRELKQMGIRVVMLTGDNARTANAIGQAAGVDTVIAGVLPEGKERIIRKLQEQGKTIMVGDGINDAPALTRADIGIAIGAGADIAVDAADVVLMKNTLTDVPAAIRLSRRTYRIIAQNLFWALIYNVLLIPAAAGVYASLFGITMSPILGAAAMSLSSLCVVLNALRLNLANIYDASHDHKRKEVAAKELFVDVEEQQPKEKQKEELINTTGEIKMKKTIRIEGMMCGHCEATVKKALEALEQVEEAQVSHETGTAVVTLQADVADDVLKKAVEEKDFQVLGIEA